jgi:YbbR domain-containing protein
VFDRIRNNLGLKVLSLALAIGAWWYLRFAANPAIAAHFDQQVAVRIVTTGLPLDEIARYSDKQAIVTIEAPRDSTAPIRPEDLRAVLNLTGRGPGVYAIPLTIVGPRLEVKAIVPNTETLEIERVSGRTRPIGLHYAGDAHGLVATKVGVSPQSATVRGASDVLSKVATVRADLAFPAQPQRVDAMVRLIPVDERGEEVAGLEVTPNYARVRANFTNGPRG